MISKISFIQTSVSVFKHDGDKTHEELVYLIISYNDVFLNLFERYKWETLNVTQKKKNVSFFFPLAYSFLTKHSFILFQTSKSLPIRIATLLG